ncbi:MAG: aminoacyl-tRNA hydrolase [Candidatus Omnitrophota bacterium]
MKLIVGLGNPGLRYQNTKHNAGFWVIDEIAKQEKISLNKQKFNSVWTKHQYADKSVILVKPATYMNLSGIAVKSFADYFNLNSDDILIVFDDISLKLGSVRLRASGSAGGHNGLHSIIENLGTNNIARLRLGIDTDADYDDLSGYVLSSFKGKASVANAKEMVKTAKAAVFCWLDEGMECAMNRFNKKRREISEYE